MFGKQAPDLFIREVYNSESQTITTSVNPLAPKKINAYGHIASLLVDVSITITKGTGTIDTTAYPYTIISNLVIRDKNSKPILETTGARIPKMRFIMTMANALDFAQYRKGVYGAGTALTDVGTAQTYQVELPLNINVDDQPISVELQLGVLSDVLSTVGTGSAVCTIQFSTKNVQTPVPNVETQRFYAVSLGSISDKQTFEQRLVRGITFDQVALDMTADANLTSCSLKPKGTNVGLDAVKAKYLQMWSNTELTSGHQTGFYILPHAPFVSGDATIFEIEPSTTVTPILYVAHRGVR